MNQENKKKYILAIVDRQGFVNVRDFAENAQSLCEALCDSLCANQVLQYDGNMQYSRKTIICVFECDEKDHIPDYDCECSGIERLHTELAQAAKQA